MTESENDIRRLLRLSPVEQAVFLLREVCGYEFDEFARLIDKSEANCRQAGGAGETWRFRRHRRRFSRFANSR